MTQFDQHELDETRIAIRYFLQQITNDDFNALCIIENNGLRWACGTKNLLTKLEEGLLPKAKSENIFEEIQKWREPQKPLENDEDVFEENMSESSTRWRFEGDCAYMIDDQLETSSAVTSRKRRRVSETSETTATIMHLSDDNDEVEDSMKPFCCNICTQGFYSKDELKTHACTQTHPKPFECDICGKGFSTKSNMQRHRNIHTKEKVFQCTHCSKKFYDSGNLKRHIEGVHNAKDESKESDEIGDDSELKSIETSVIRALYDDQTPMSTAVSTPSPISSNRSSLNTACSSLSESIKVELEQSDEEKVEIIKNEPLEPHEAQFHHHHHYMSHTERPHSYTCDKCLHRFETKDDALTHLRVAHPGSENQHCLRVEQPISKPNEKPFTYKLFYCAFCWKEFTWRANLVRHINIHTHEKSFPCSMCKKTFSSHTSLRRHEQKHQGINYKCARCARSFNDPSNLRRHEQSCNGEASLSEDEIAPEIQQQQQQQQQAAIKVEKKEEVKPHRCGYCSKSFGRAERLEEHLRTHTGETPFKCDICLKGFTTKHNLLRHRNIHTLEKKYTCEICFKYFADPTQHKRHQATHFAKHNKDGAKGGRKPRSSGYEPGPVSLVIPEMMR